MTIRGRLVDVGLSHGNRFRSRADAHVGEIGLGDHSIGDRLAVARGQFRIVDLKQGGPGFDVFAPLDENLDDPAIDAGGHVGSGAVGFALDQKRRRPRQKPEAEADNGKESQRNPDGGTAPALWGFGGDGKDGFLLEFNFSHGRASPLRISWCLGAATRNPRL